MTASAIDDASASHLRLLSIFHYVFASLGLLAIGFLLLHYYMMSTMMDPAFFAKHDNPPPEGFFDIFLWMYAIFGAICVIGMTLNVLAGRFLAQRRHWMFCAVVAGLNCLNMPLGTVLGVFTLVVLTRDAVRSGFDR